MSSGESDRDLAGRSCHVFISYSRDDRPQALKVIAALEQSGIEVWWDGLLTGGETFLQTTETMLETAEAVVVLWTERSVASDWVRDEAQRGRDRKCLVPVTLDGVIPPLGFRQIQYIDLSRWQGQVDAPAFGELLRAIGQVGVGRSAAAPLLRIPDRPLLNRRSILVGAGAAAVAASVFGSWKAGLFDSVGDGNSIAVMPFRNLSADPARAYFSDGLAEELRAMLSLNRQLAVAAQSSSNSLREAQLVATAVANKLGVDFVLEGSVQTAGDGLRVVARLVNGVDGFEKWSQVFDRKLADVLTVQSEIAVLVTDSLVSKLVAADESGKTRLGGTRNTKAFDAYLRGAALYNLAQDEASDRQALAAFEEAIRIDPDYAVAHAARSRALTIIGSSYASGNELAAWNDKALAAAQRAVELTPELAEAQSALGLVLMNSRLDLAAAGQPMERSLERGFGNAGILTAYAIYASYVGAFEQGRTAVARAKRLDPLNAAVWRTAGLLEFAARNFAAAESEMRSALSFNGKINAANRVLGDVAFLKGDLAASEQFYSAEPSKLSRIRGLATVLQRKGDRAGAERQMELLLAEFGENSLYQQAQILAQWGERDRAMQALERGLAIRDSGLLLAAQDALLDPIRQAPGFTAILARLGAQPARAQP